MNKISGFEEFNNQKLNRVVETLSVKNIEENEIVTDLISKIKNNEIKSIKEKELPDNGSVNVEYKINVDDIETFKFKVNGEVFKLEIGGKMRKEGQEVKAGKSYLKKLNSEIIKYLSIKNKKNENIILGFDEYFEELNEGKMTGDAKIIKDILDSVEDFKNELKVKYTENETKGLFDISYEFKIDGEKYIYNRKKSKSNELTVLIKKGSEVLLDDVLVTKSVISLANKLDVLLIGIYRK